MTRNRGKTNLSDSEYFNFMTFSFICYFFMMGIEVKGEKKMIKKPLVKNVRQNTCLIVGMFCGMWLKNYFKYLVCVAVNKCVL